MAEGQGRFFPEQGNRQPPRGMERRGGTRFNVSAPPRPGGVTTTPDRPTTTPTLPPPDTVQPSTEQAPQKPKKRHTGRNIALAGTALGVLGAGAYETYQNVPAVHQAVDSAFLDHLRGQSSPSESSVFDNSATKGVISEKNTIQMTPEEYQKIAPPRIDRTNVKQVPVELNIPPGLDGRTTRKLTLEQGTTVNAMIYVKTADGNIRDVTYIKVTSPGEVTGVGPTPIVFPGCEVSLGQKDEIQAGDIFPAPISGRVYYHGSKTPDYYKGQKVEDGANIGGNYYIEGEYRDPETGKKFKATARIHTLEPINKPLVENVPHLEDYIQGTSWVDAVKKMPIITVEQGANLFQFLTKPPVQHFSSASPIRSQVEITFTYKGDIGENGIANTFGGENCTSPILDNKAIVLK